MIRHFTVPLPPLGKQSVRAAVVDGHARVFKTSETRHFLLDVAKSARDSGWTQMLEGPVWVRILAVSPRPAYLLARYKKGNLPKYPVGLLVNSHKPDADNIAKSILDGLRGLLEDDSRVWDLRVLTVYAELNGLPRTDVWVGDQDGDGALQRPPIFYPDPARGGKSLC